MFFQHPAWFIKPINHRNVRYFAQLNNVLVNQYSFTNTRFRLFFFVNEQYENTSSFVFRWEYGLSFVKHPFTPTMCYYGSLTLRLIGAKMDRNRRKLETDSHFESRSTDNTKKQNNHNKELKRLSRITRSHISTLLMPF